MQRESGSAKTATSHADDDGGSAGRAKGKTDGEWETLVEKWDTNLKNYPKDWKQADVDRNYANMWAKRSPDAKAAYEEKKRRERAPVVATDPVKPMVEPMEVDGGEGADDGNTAAAGDGVGAAEGLLAAAAGGVVDAVEETVDSAEETVDAVVETVGAAGRTRRVGNLTQAEVFRGASKAAKPYSEADLMEEKEIADKGRDRDAEAGRRKEEKLVAAAEKKKELAAKRAAEEEEKENREWDRDDEEDDHQDGPCFKYEEIFGGQGLQGCLSCKEAFCARCRQGVTSPKVSFCIRGPTKYDRFCLCMELNDFCRQVTYSS